MRELPEAPAVQLEGRHAGKARDGYTRRSGILPLVLRMWIFLLLDFLVPEVKNCNDLYRPHQSTSYLSDITISLFLFFAHPSFLPRILCARPLETLHMFPFSCLQTNQTTSMHRPVYVKTTRNINLFYGRSRAAFGWLMRYSRKQICPARHKIMLRAAKNTSRLLFECAYLARRRYTSIYFRILR